MHTGTDPVRVWGELSSTYRVRERGEDSGRNRNWLNTASIAASRYIWRPWFATVSGSLDLTVDDTRDDGQPDSESEYTTGDARFSLFPTSRFPFNAYFIESRDEFDNQSFASDVNTTEYGLNQRYRTPDGRHNYLAEYENESQERDSDDDFVFDTLRLGADNRFGDHTFETDFNLDSVDDKELNEDASSQVFTIDHTYEPDSNFSLENLVGNTISEADLTDTSGESEISQLVSFLSWYPGDRDNLRVTGTLRATETRDQVDFLGNTTREPIDNEISTATVNQGLIYDYTNELQFTESINSTYSESDSETTTVSSESVGARYAPGRIPTGLGDYGWSVSSVFFNEHGDIESERTIESEFDHSLANDYSRPNHYSLNTDLTQSVFYEYDSNSGDDKSLDHSYSVTWANGGNRNENLLRFFISDSRALNEDGDYFQLINLQYTGAIRINRYSQFSGNLTLQRTDQKDEGDRSEQQVNNGQLLYQHNRLFQVNGLSFFSDLQVSRRKSEVERLLEDESDTEISLENSLFYRIGRLEVEVALDFVRVDDEFDRLFKLRLTRSFGDL